MNKHSVLYSPLQQQLKDKTTPLRNLEPKQLKREKDILREK